MNQTTYVYKPGAKLGVSKLIHTLPNYEKQNNGDDLLKLCQPEVNGNDGTCRAFTAAVPMTTATSIKDPNEELFVVDLFYVVILRSIIRLSGKVSSTVGNHAVDLIRMDGLNPKFKDPTLNVSRFTPEFPWLSLSRMHFGDRPDILEYQVVSTELQVSLRRDAANLATLVTFGNMYLERLDAWYPKQMTQEMCISLFGVDTVLAWDAFGFDICEV